MFKGYKTLYILLSFCVMFSGLITLSDLLVKKVEAAGVQLTVTSPSNAEFASLTATNVTFRYDPSSSEFATSNTILISINPALAGAVTDCTPTATTDLDGDGTPDGSFGSFSTSGAIYTLSAPTTTATSTFATMCLRFPASTTTGVYSIAFTDDNDGDFGAALVYVGDDNDVTVTATVNQILTFAIRNSGDTSDTNTCALGLLTVTSVNTCAYRLKVNTNSASGYTVQITSDGDLRRSGSGDVADSEDIDPIAENSTVSSGTEGYGIAFNGGSATSGTITESGNFNDDDTPIPMAATNLYTSNGSNNPGTSGDTTNTALVTHRASVDAGTNTGNYQHIVTYYVSASF